MPIGSPLFVSHVRVDGVARDLVLVASESGELQARDATDGSLVWERSFGSVVTGCPDLPGSRFGIGGTPVIDRTTSRVYVVASMPDPASVGVFALSLATGRTVPGWPVSISGDPLHMHDWGALTLAAGTLYVPLASMCDRPPDFGRVVAIDVRSAGVSTTWFVVTHDGLPVGGGGVWAAGGLSVDGSGDLFAATGNAEYPYPESQPYGESVVRLSPQLEPLDHHAPPLSGRDVDFGSAPVLLDADRCPPQLVVPNKDGHVFLYRRDDLARGPTQTLKVVDDRPTYGLLMGSPAWDAATQTLVLANPGPAADGFTHGLIGFELGTDCRLHVRWERTFGPDGATNVSGPTIAGGLAWYVDGTDGRLAAVDESTGALRWSADVGPSFAPPIVVGSWVYVAAWDSSGGQLWAFAPAA